MLLDLQKECQAQSIYDRYSKFQLLKQPVYSKIKPKNRTNLQKNPNAKSAISSLHISHSSPKNSKKNLTLPKTLIQSQLRQQNLQKKRSAQSLKMKDYRTITLDYDCNKTGFSHEKQPSKPSFQYMNNQFFSKNPLRKTNYEKRCIKQTKIKDRSNQINNNFFQGKDTQCLLRKSSLFLLSFIKTRQKEKKKAPCIGDMPALTQLLHLTDFHLDEYQLKQLKKRNSMIKEQTEKKRKQNNNHKYRKLDELEQKPIIPQPW